MWPEHIWSQKHWASPTVSLDLRHLTAAVSVWAWLLTEAVCMFPTTSFSVWATRCSGVFWEDPVSDQPRGRQGIYLLILSNCQATQHTSNFTYYCSFVSSCSRESWPTRPNALNAKRGMIPGALFGLCHLPWKIHGVRPAVWYGIIFNQEEKSRVV